MKYLPNGEAVDADNALPYSTTADFDHTKPVSDENPLPVAVSPANYAVGEVPSTTNRVPVVFVGDGDANPTFQPGEPISKTNPLPIATGPTRKAAWKKGSPVLGSMPIPGVIPVGAIPALRGKNVSSSYDILLGQISSGVYVPLVGAGL